MRKAEAVAARELDEDFFGMQPSRRADLPDPEPLLGNLTRCVFEVLAGARDLEQMMRWITDDVYQKLLTRTVLASRARAVRKQSASRPNIAIARIIVTEPRDGVVEAVVLVNTPQRTRAVAIRLEGMDQRWRATAITVM